MGVRSQTRNLDACCFTQLQPLGEQILRIDR